MSDELTGPGFVQQLLHGNLVKTADTAIALAEALLRGNFGESALVEQRPLVATDSGDTWLVEGSLNKDKSKEGPGRLIARIAKSDARVISLTFDYVIHQSS